MSNKKKIIYAAIALAAVLFVACVATAWSWWHSLYAQPFNIQSTKYIYVHPNDSEQDILQQLQDSAQMTTTSGWTVASRFTTFTPHTGCYAIEPSDKLIDVYRRLKGGQQTPVRLVVPSIRTLDRMAQALSRQIMLDSATIATALSDSAFAYEMGYTLQQLPALFIPNTYEVYWDISLNDLMRRMEKENSAFWKRERREQIADSLDMSYNEIYTLASIIDEETADNAEKPRIAGVYLNRLRMGIPLQADPTVKYAVGDFTLKRILREHLQVRSPYNTYQRLGLPPGPIRVASIAGIDAVLNAEHHDYLYFCAKEDFSGTHNFATTLAEHNRNARRYQRALNMRGIR